MTGSSSSVLPAESGNQVSNNLELQLRLIGLAGVHGQLIAAILGQARGVIHGHGVDTGHLIGASAIGGGVIHQVAQFDILQFLERSSVAVVPVVAGQTNVAIPARSAAEVSDALA